MALYPYTVLYRIALYLIVLYCIVLYSIVMSCIIVVIKARVHHAKNVKAEIA